MFSKYQSMFTKYRLLYQISIDVYKDRSMFCKFQSMFAKKVLKTFQEMLKDVGMAVPKTTATRCRDGSVQARHVIQRLHK